MKSYKKDFPIFKNSDLVYLDSAATSQKPKVVLDAIKEYYETYNANVRRGLYPIAEKATQKVEDVRRQVSKFINAKDSSEIIFVRNTTEAINLVMNCMDDGRFETNRSITTTIMEHHSNFVPWQFLAQMRYSPFEVIDITDWGYLNEKEIIEKTKNSEILAITYVSNVLGTINPMKEITKKVRKINPGIKILVDGAQAVPHMKVDVQDLDCDFFAFSGHKMMASTGIGVLYGKKKLLNDMSPFLFGGEMIREVKIEETTFADVPWKFEAGTPDIAGVISLGAAIEYLENIGMDKIRNHELGIMNYALEHMNRIKGLTIYGPARNASASVAGGPKNINHRSGLISFTMNGIHPHDIAQILGDMNICIRAGHHCAQPLHTRLGIPATARISFYIYNDASDIDRFIGGLEKIKKMFKV